MIRTWEAIQLFPPQHPRPRNIVVGWSEHAPFVSDVLDKLVHREADAENVTMSIVKIDTRLLSFVMPDGQAYVYLIAAFDRRG